MDEPGGESTGESTGELNSDREAIDNARPTGDGAASLPPPSGTPTFAVSEHTEQIPEPEQAELVLPPVVGKAPPPMIGPAGPAPAAGTWYRSDQQRYRSVYRRANPWYRRVGRGLIALAILAAVGAGLYVAVDAARDYVNRDKLPSPGSEVASFTQSAFLVHSEPPAPAVDGTLTIDSGSGAFQFVGAPEGPQANTELVSPDGTRVYIRSANGNWREATDDDPVASDVQSVIPLLTGVNGPDDVLVNRMRQGYIDLVDESVVGTDSDAVSTFKMAINTASFAADYPLQWQAFNEEVVPQMVESGSTELRMSVDSENVVVGLDASPQWRWQRLRYSSDPLQPLDPTGSISETPPTTVAGG